MGVMVPGGCHICQVLKRILDNAALALPGWAEHEDGGRHGDAGGRHHTAMSADLIAAIVDEGLGNSSYLVDLGDRRAPVIDPQRDPLPYPAAAGRPRPRPA